ncbi:hypothetical protein GW916_11020 [bacterium]|nr:hypothetical protein [bacterium]
MKVLSLCLLAGLLISNPALSHGVHDSGDAKPQKGGVIKSLESLNVELVQIDGEVRVYIFGKDEKSAPLETSKYPVSAKVTYPREKGSHDVKLTAHENHWSAKVDAKGSHRYLFEFHIEQAGHKDNLKFNIEPK